MEVSGDVLIELMAVHFCCKGRKKPGNPLTVYPRKRGSLNIDICLIEVYNPTATPKYWCLFHFHFCVLHSSVRGLRRKCQV
jgi:hypothetical protein